MDLSAVTKHTPGRTVWVLIHKDHTHVQSLPGGEPDWSYEKADMELREKILEKDFNNKNYYIIDAASAILLIANKQAELVKAWTPTINLIRKARQLQERRVIYQRFRKRTSLPHPIEADGLLKSLLRW